MSAEVVGNRGGELFSFDWSEYVECVLLTVTYAFVNGKGITPYFGIMSEWGSADLAAAMEYIKDGQLSSVFSWRKKEVEGQMLVLAAQPYFISWERSTEAHHTYSMTSQVMTTAWFGFCLLPVHHYWSGTCY